MVLAEADGIGPSKGMFDRVGSTKGANTGETEGFPFFVTEATTD